jgi:hypothetical protein
MNVIFTQAELLAKGGIQDSISQIRIVHNMGTYLFTQVFYGNEKRGFEILNSY